MNRRSALVRELVSAVEFSQRLLESRLHVLGINGARYSVLRSLWEADGRMSQVTLAEKLHLSESNLSTLLDRMGRDRLITRTRSLLDRRKSLLELTADGRALAEKGRQIEATLAQELFSPLSDETCVQWEKTLLGLMAAWQDQLVGECEVLQCPEGARAESYPSQEDEHAQAG